MPALSSCAISQGGESPPIIPGGGDVPHSPPPKATSEHHVNLLNLKSYYLISGMDESSGGCPSVQYNSLEKSVHKKMKVAIDLKFRYCILGYDPLRST